MIIGSKKIKNGFATLEIIIALALVFIFVPAVVSITLGNYSLTTDSQTNSQARHIAQQLLESAQAAARESFFSLNSVSPVNEDIYTKELKVDWIDDYVKKVTSRVVWKSSPLLNQKVDVETIVTSPLNAARGDTCDPQLTGDWQHPQLIGYLDIVSSSGATDIDTRLHKVYLTADPSATGTEDFYIIDVSDPVHPAIISKINTGPGLVGVHVAGNYAYVANVSINAQLQVIDISNPAAPVVKVNFKVPGVTGSGGGGVGHSIFYKNGMVYLGLTKTDSGPEFNIIDVANPLNPQYRGGWQARTQINDIYVKDNIAYLATPQPDPATPQKENLSVLDISNPAAASRVNTFTSVNATLQSGESFFFDGGTLYFGRSDGDKTRPNNKELFVLGVSNPYAIATVGSQKIGSGASSLILRDKFLFVMASNPNEGFQIWDVSNPLSITKYASLNVQQTATGGLDCEGNLIYIAERSNKALQIIGPTAIPQFDYVLTNSAPGGSITININSSQTINVDRALVSGTPAGVALSFAIIPNTSKITGSFTNNPCSPDCSSSLTITVKNSASPGNYMITVTGSPDGSGPRSTSFELKVP